MVPVRRVIVRDDLGGRTDYRSGCCQRCCQLVDHVDPRPRLPDCRCAWPQLLPHCAPGALTVQRATMHVGTRRYLGRSRCRVVSISIWVAPKCALARRQPAATRRQPSDPLSGRPERRGRGTAPPAKQRPAEMPAASTTREALKNTRGSRPQSAPAAGIECVSTAHRPPSQLADATPIDSARKATPHRSASLSLDMDGGSSGWGSSPSAILATVSPQHVTYGTGESNVRSCGSRARTG